MRSLRECSPASSCQLDGSANDTVEMTLSSRVATNSQHPDGPACRRRDWSSPQELESVKGAATGARPVDGGKIKRPHGGVLVSTSYIPLHLGAGNAQVGRTDAQSR